MTRVLHITLVLLAIITWIFLFYWNWKLAIVCVVAMEVLDYYHRRTDTEDKCPICARGNKPVGNVHLMYEGPDIICTKE